MSRHQRYHKNQLGHKIAVANRVNAVGRYRRKAKTPLKQHAGDGICGARDGSGTEWQDNSMMAVVPIPIIGLGMPTQEINEIKADDVLSKCGPAERLVNRRVEVDRTACIPTVLTRLISFGVWQWCPANVSWAADVTAPAPAPQPNASTSPPPAPEREILSYRPSQ